MNQKKEQAGYTGMLSRVWSLSWMPYVFGSSHWMALSAFCCQSVVGRTVDDEKLSFSSKGEGEHCSVEGMNE